MQCKPLGMFPGAVGIRSGRDTYEIIARKINKKKESPRALILIEPVPYIRIYVPLFSSARKNSGLSFTGSKRNAFHGKILSCNLFNFTDIYLFSPKISTRNE